MGNRESSGASWKILLLENLCIVSVCLSFSSEFVIGKGPRRMGILFGGTEMEEYGAEYFYFSFYKVSSVLDAVTLYLRLSL